MLTQNKSIQIKASTLSVILEGSTSVHCYLKIGGDSSNVTLRLDRGDEAIICGYPQHVAVFDTYLEQFNYDSGTCYSAFELQELDPKDFGYDYYIGPEIEIEILNQLIKSLKKQFKNKMFLDSCSEVERNQALQKILKRIENLDSGNHEGIELDEVIGGAR
jgi:hypothetical protein